MSAAISRNPTARDTVNFNLQNFIDTGISLGKTKALHPLFEAIANSFDSIAEGKLKTPGRIEIRVLRNMNEKVQLDTDGGKAEHPILGFEVVDNGEGFTDKNFLSFQEGSTPLKKKQGGKGMGRFLWLKVFKESEIQSYYLQNREYRVRSFRFASNSNDGIERHIHNASPTTKKQETTVRLLGLNQSYTWPKKVNTIARHIIEHNLVELLLNPTLEMILTDPDCDSGSINLGDMFRKQYNVHSNRDKFQIGGYDFELTHITVSSSGLQPKNRVVFCAKRRAVESRNLENKIPHLLGSLFIDGTQQWYMGTLTGDYFETHVNHTRTAILLDDDDQETPSFTQSVNESTIMESVCKHVQAFLQKPLESIKHTVSTKVTKLVNASAPEYRGILTRNPDILNRISSNATEGEIISTLASARFSERQQHLDNIASILQKAGSSEHLDNLSKHKLAQFYQGAHQEATECMVKFVFHRQSVLDLLNLYLGTTIQDRHETEAAVHNLIFPMRNTSDSFPADMSNLWVIDERLVFHNYLASDMPLSDHQPIESEVTNRSDIAVYHLPDDDYWNAAFALSEQSNNFSSVTIIEFKRPDRDDYTRDKNPYDQIYNYVLDIRDGKKEDREGRRFPRPKNLRFVAYIIVDITDKLRNILMDAKGFMEMVDGDGLYKIEPHLNLHVEVMSYQKMIQNAKQRNAAFFKSLKME